MKTKTIATKTMIGGSRQRHVVVGDVHGELEGLLEILTHAGLTNGNGNWIGGNAVLVQTGDVIDRGPHSREAVAFLRKLQGQALAASIIGSGLYC